MMIPCPGFRELENLSDMRHDTTRHDTTRLVPLADSIHSFSLARYHVTVTCNVHRRPSDVSPRHERVKPNELLYAFVEQAGEKRSDSDASTVQHSLEKETSTSQEARSAAPDREATVHTVVLVRDSGICQADGKLSFIVLYILFYLHIVSDPAFFL